ncbi:MAG: glycosyltransferase [Bacteroidales bacterium]|nr:glycosyltransferase [Bacteroidales bacterium]
MKTNVLYIGVNGFPYGMATIQRQLLIAKALTNIQDSSCKVLCRYGVNPKTNNSKRHGIYEEIEYNYAAPLAYSHNNFTIRTLNKIVGSFNEFFFFLKLRKKNENNVLLSVRTSFIRTIYYKVISIIFGYKYIVDINESLSDNKNTSFIQKTNNILYDKYSSMFCNGIIVISEFLLNHYKEINKKIRIIKIPVICDINKIDNIPTITNSIPYLLYCSSATYFESIKFVVDSFEIINNININLFLIISGSNTQMERVKNLIFNSSKKENIILKSNLSYNNLIGHYKGAKALLIPLPETIQHQARFPHKMAEYAASKVPIISNKWGESINYFNNESLFYCEKYNVNEFAQMINNVVTNSDSYNDMIKENAYSIAKKHFDYLSISEKLIKILVK